MTEHQTSGPPLGGKAKGVAASGSLSPQASGPRLGRSSAWGVAAPRPPWAAPPVPPSRHGPLLHVYQWEEFVVVGKSAIHNQARRIRRPKAARILRATAGRASVPSALLICLFSKAANGVSSPQALWPMQRSHRGNGLKAFTGVGGVGHSCDLPLGHSCDLP